MALARDTQQQAPMIPRRFLILALVVLLAASFLLRVPLISVPLERDEGEYAYIAQRLLHGEVPYRDAFDQKPPLIFFLYFAAMLAFGFSTQGIHLGMHLYSLVTIFMLYRLAARLLNPWAGLLAAALLSVTVAGSGYLGNAANTEIFMILPLIWGLSATLGALEGDRPRLLLGSGALHGLALACKQVALTNLVFVVLLAVLWRQGGRRPSPGTVAARLGWLLLGCLAPWVLIVGYFALNGALGDFIHNVFIYNFTYAARLSFGIGIIKHFLFQAGWILRNDWVTLAAALGGLAYLLVRPSTRHLGCLLAGWLVFSFAGTSIGWYYRPHYFIQTIPAVAALAAAGLWAGGRGLVALGGRFTGGKAGWGGWVAAALLWAGVVATPAALEYPRYLSFGPEAISRYTYMGNPFIEAMDVAQYLREHSEPDDSVFILGSEPEILFYAQRKSATRYIFFYPLMTCYPGVRQDQEKAVEEMARAYPKFIVVINIRTSLLASKCTERYIFGALKEYLKRYYTVEGHGTVPINRRGRMVWGNDARRNLEAARKAQIQVFRRRD